jgi:hypothetical protein
MPASKLNDIDQMYVREQSARGRTSDQIAESLAQRGTVIHPSNVRRFLAKTGKPLTAPTAPLAAFAMNTKAAQMAELLADQEPMPPLLYKAVPDGKRVAFISDPQIPFHDPTILGSPHKKEALYENFLRGYQPDYIFIVGDAIDCYSLSSFDKNPHRIFNTKDELAMAGNMLDGFRKACPDADIIWIDGNHEFRLWRTYMELCAKDSKVLEVLGALNIKSLDTDSLLHLHDRGVEYQPYGGHVNFLSFIITHGDVVRQQSSYTAKAMYDKWHSSGASGHTHRLGTYHFTDGTGRSHAWYELGSTCLNTLEYVSNPNWQQGFGYGEVLRNKLHFQLAPIFDNALVVPGVGVFQR